MIWYYFHKYYFKHAEEGFLLAYFACKNQSVVLHFFCCWWLFVLVFFGCGFFFISFSWNSPFCTHTFYHKPGWGPPIWALTKLPCLKLHSGFLYFSISLDLYSIYLFLALKATVHIVSLPSETASFSPSLHWRLQFLSME